MSRTVDGKPLRVVGTHADISRRKFLEDVAEQANTRYRAIFNSTSQFIGLLNPEGTLLEANQTALDFAGIKPDDVVGKPFWECHWWLTSPETQAQLRHAVARAAAGETVRYTVEVRGQADTTAIIDFSLTPIRDTAGDVVLIVPEGHNITEQVQAKRALDARERLFRAVFGGSPIGAAIVDLDGTWLEANDALCDMLGYSETALKRMTFQDITHPDDLDSDLAHVQRLLDGEASRYRMEKRYICLDQQIIYCQLDVSMVRDEQDRAVCFMAQIQDLTDQREAERALEEEKDLAQITLTSIGDGVIRTDLHGEITFVNDTALRLLKIIERDLLGQAFEASVRMTFGSEGPLRESPVARVLREGMPVPLDKDSTLLLRDQSFLPVEGSCTPVRDREQRLVGSVFVFRDVSSTRQLAQQLAFQASHDALTGLPNRRQFEAKLDAARLVAQIRPGEHYMLMLDLDYFKRINDQCGHLVGDHVLKEIAARMRGRLRQTDLLARLGGDEFGLILIDCPLAQVTRIADGLIRSVATYNVTLEGCTYPLGVSIGVAAIDAQMDAAQIIRGADQACYTAKARGRGRAVIQSQVIAGETSMPLPERRVPMSL